MKTPALSVVIPVYNEEDGLAVLSARLYPVFDALGILHEVVSVSDGNRDHSVTMLAEQFHTRLDSTRVVLFSGNYDQHMAILVDFEHMCDERVVILSIDLQNPSEGIGCLIGRLDEGYDYVGTIRHVRWGSWLRRAVSYAMNSLYEHIMHIKMTDRGCMLRVYDRTIVSTINRCHEVNIFISVLAYTFSRNPTEIEVDHEEYFAGGSKYLLYKLVRLNSSLVTGFSVVPLQWFSATGVLLPFASAVLFILLVIRRFVLGAEAQGVFAPFVVTFFLMSVLLFGTGLLGKHTGRIYQQVHECPRYLVQGVLEETSHLHEAGAADLKTGSQQGAT